MFEVSTKLTFCYAHRLINYTGKCANLHGHNGVCEIVLAAPELDPRGMVVDFFDVKQIMRSWVESELDHRTILHRQDPLVPLLGDLEQQLYVMDENPTAENIARECFRFAKSAGLPVVSVTLWENDISYAKYSER